MKIRSEFKRATAIATLLASTFGTIACRRQSDFRPGYDPGEAAKSLQNDLCLYGCPTGAPGADEILDHKFYLVSFNPETRFGDWVAYKVQKDMIGPSRRREWHMDPLLRSPADSLSVEDYKDSASAHGYDRGHQAPEADFTNNPDYQDANELTNITPQAKQLNRGPWKALEGDERDLAKNKGLQPFVLTGTLYEGNVVELPTPGHKYNRIPSGYFKIEAVQTKDGILTAAFIMAQTTPAHTSPCLYTVTVREVEERKHIHVFPRLTDRSFENARGGLLPLMGCN